MAAAGPDMEGGSDTKIKLIVVVVTDNYSQIHFIVKMSTPMYKVRNACAETLGVPAQDVLLLFDGNYLLDSETPELLQMDDGNLIEAFIENTQG